MPDEAAPENPPVAPVPAPPVAAPEPPVVVPEPVEEPAAVYSMPLDPQAIADNAAEAQRLAELEQKEH